jgi:hypothetical protein
MEGLLIALVVTYWVGVLVGSSIMRVRAGAGFWRRLQIFGPDGFGPAWFTTLLICTMAWPVTLVVWLIRGRPEPRVVFNEKARERRQRQAAGGGR